MFFLIPYSTDITAIDAFRIKDTIKEHSYKMLLEDTSKEHPYRVLLKGTNKEHSYRTLHHTDKCDFCLQHSLRNSRNHSKVLLEPVWHQR